MRNRLALGGAALAALAGGCSTQPRVNRENAAEVSLIPVTYAAWQKRLEGYKGRITVVDFWATWCAPCVERFPHMVQLSGRFGPRGVRFVSVSLDDRGDPGALEQARAFLKKQKASFENYLMDENMTDAFQMLDLLSIPAVLIYDREGKLRYKLTGDDPNHQFTSADVDRAVEELVGSSG